MRRALLAILVACAALGVGAREASAEPLEQSSAALPPHIVLRGCDCSPLPFNEEALASRLRVELAEAGVRSIDIKGPGEASGAGREREVTVTLLGACSGGELTVVINDRDGPGAHSSVNVGIMDRAVRERSLALAIAELLRSRLSDLAAADAKAERAADPDAPSSAPGHPREAQPPAPAKAEPGRPDVSDLPALRQREPRGAPTLLSAGIEWRFFLGRNTALTGGRFVASLPAGSDWILRLSAEAGAFYDSEEDGAGAVELWLVTGGLGVSFGYSWELAEIGLGPRLELGFGHTSAAAPAMAGEPQSDSAAITIASMVATGRVRLGPRLWLSMDLEIGYVLRGLSTRSLDRAPLGIGGATGGGRLGVALEL